MKISLPVALEVFLCVLLLTLRILIDWQVALLEQSAVNPSR